MATEIWLIRHGETEWSRSGQHTGKTDLPLLPEGREKAARLAAKLGPQAFAHVLTSPLRRARETCELAGLGPAARLHPGLVEWDYGDYEGKTSAQILVQEPGWSIFLKGAPGGESPAEVSYRADRVLAELRGLEGRVAIFSHGHFIRALGVRWVGLPIEAGRFFGLGTASISVLGHDRQHPVIASWNHDP